MIVISNSQRDAIVRYLEDYATYPCGKSLRMLSGIPISDIGQINRADTQRVDKEADKLIECMPFGKHKGEKIAETPLNYRQWMLANFRWDGHNARLRQSIIATI